MPVAKLKASGTPDVMKTEDGIDTIIRQAIGREPFLSFPRASDNPVQWIQLLHALDQQELPGWPFLTPIKVQLLKCEKCAREFCSLINYRRHIRAQHRLKKLAKDSTKNRDLLGAYWDTLSVEEAKKVVSFNNVMLEEVPGSSILTALTNLVQRQAFSPFPLYYVRAGAALLDIVRSEPSSFPISSQELFSILDDASEKTCLCGTAVSMQRYVFDGEAGKVGLEPKNIVACTSFLLEQKLVNAWLADKDAEALRCQKQLVEEEEAAQKRQAEIVERKRQKKLRQKEQKAREQRHENGVEIKENDCAVEALAPAEASLDTHDFEADNPDTSVDNAPSHVPSQSHDTNKGIVGDAQSGYELGSDQNIWPDNQSGYDLGTDQNIGPDTQSGYVLGADQNIGPDTQSGNDLGADQNIERDTQSVHDLGADQNIERDSQSGDDLGPDQYIERDTQSGYDLGADQKNIERQSAHGHNRSAHGHNRSAHGHNHQLVAVARRQGLPKSQQAVANGSPISQNSLVSKLDVIQKYEANHEQRAAAMCNGIKVWSQKPKREIERVGSKATVEKETDQVKNNAVLIGSISVTLGNRSQSEGNTVASQEDLLVENLPKQNNSQDKPTKPDFDQSSNNRLAAKFWRPVSRHSTKGPVAVNGSGTEADTVNGNGDCQNLSGPSSLRLCSVDGSDIGTEKNFPHPEGTEEQRNLRLSSQAARAFLAQRWKQAISSDHVKLVISPNSEPPGCQEIHDSDVAAGQFSDVNRCNNHANGVSRLIVTSGVTKSKPRSKPEKGTKKKYIPKQKTAT